MKLRNRVICFALCGLAGKGAFAAPAEENAAVKAERLFKTRCASAGEKITRTVDNVAGLILLKLRPLHHNFDQQFALDDPYGSDVPGRGYIGTFLRENYDLSFRDALPSLKLTRAMLPTGYRFVDVLVEERIRYRYTGRIEEPWVQDHHYLKGYQRFVMDSAPATAPAPRYGVDYHDISTEEDRRLWIAGSSLQVIDLKTKEVIAERIGYMFDPGQGNRSGSRSPWLMAASYACPSFGSKRGFAFQSGQTLRFVEKVLHPLQEQ